MYSTTPNVCCRFCLWKIKFKFTSCAPGRRLVDLLWCPSASQSLASRTSSLSIRGWRSTAAITAIRSCHSSCYSCDVSDDFFIFQQDSVHVSAHRAPDTVRFLEQSTSACIPPDLWPPNSADLNPINYNFYKICGDVQQRVHQSQLQSIDELKKCLLDVRLVQQLGQIGAEFIEQPVDVVRLLREQLRVS